MSDIMSDVVGMLNDAASKAEPIVDALDSLDKEIRSGRNSDKVINTELRPAISGKKHDLNVLKESTRKAVAAYIDEQVAAIEQAEHMDPDDLDENTMRLLASDFPLRDADWATLFERFSKNRTMLRVLFDAAHKRNVPTGRWTNIRPDEKITAVNQLRGVTDLYIDHWLGTSRAREMVGRMFDYSNGGTSDAGGRPPLATHLD